MLFSGCAFFIAATSAVAFASPMTPATDAIMGAVPPEKFGVGSALNDTTREIGGTLGVAIVGSVMSSIYGSHIIDTLSGTGLPAGAVQVRRQPTFVSAQRCWRTPAFPSSARNWIFPASRWTAATRGGFAPGPRCARSRSRPGDRAPRATTARATPRREENPA